MALEQMFADNVEALGAFRLGMGIHNEFLGMPLDDVLVRFSGILGGHMPNCRTELQSDIPEKLCNPISKLLQVTKLPPTNLEPKKRENILQCQG